jgi:predicted dehydrogenase
LINKFFKIKKIAIIGLGSIGKKHLRILKKIRPEIEVFLVRSGSGKSLEKEEKLIKKTFFSLDEVLEVNLDAAIISTPAPFHLNEATKLINKKVPLLIEKPLSDNLNNIENFKKLANKSGLKILVGYVLRYSRSLNFFYEMFNSGQIGSINEVQIQCLSYLPNWRPNQDYLKSVSARKDLGGGVLLELSHELDYANWLFGPFLNMDAKILNTKTLDINVEDEAKLKLLTVNKYMVSIHLNFSNKEKNVRQCILKSSLGTLIWDGIKNSVTWNSNDGKINNWFFKNENEEMFQSQIEHFLTCIENNEDPKVTINNGIDALNLIDLARRSDKLKKKLKYCNII